MSLGVLLRTVSRLNRHTMGFPRVNVLTGKLEIPNEYDQTQPAIQLSGDEPFAPMPQVAPPQRPSLSTGGKIRSLFDGVIFDMARGLGAASGADTKVQAQTAAFGAALQGPQVREDRDLKRQQAQAELSQIPIENRYRAALTQKAIDDLTLETVISPIDGRSINVRKKDAAGIKKTWETLMGAKNRQDDQQAFTAEENAKKLSQRKDEQAFREKNAGLKLEITKALQAAKAKAALVGGGSAAARLKIQQQNADLAREKFQAFEKHKAIAEKLAQESFEDSKRHRAAGDDMKADLFDMKARGYLQDAESMVGPIDSLLSFAGITTDDMQAAKNAQGVYDKVNRKGAASPQRKVGDKKTFDNGKTGVWDGEGWVLQ